MMTSPDRIDTHHHIVPPDYAAWLSRKGVDAGGREIPFWSRDSALELMDSAGIETAIMSVSTPGVEPAGSLTEGRSIARDVNEYAAAVMAADPARFGFFATLTLPDVDGALAEVEYAFDHLHADGVVLLANSKGIYLGDPSFNPLMQELNRRKALVFVHPSHLQDPGVPGIPAYIADFLLDTTRAAVNLVLQGTLSKYPDIRFVLSHGGGFLPYAATRIALAFGFEDSAAKDEKVAELRRFYFDTALSSSHSALPSLIAFADPERITFGSDWPYAITSTAKAFTATLDSFDVSGDVHAAINRGNAERLFPRLARVPATRS
jgi:6-methylsalicylate decarboxylase